MPNEFIKLKHAYTCPELLRLDKADFERSAKEYQNLLTTRGPALLPIATRVAQCVMEQLDNGRNLRYLGSPHRFIEHDGKTWKNTSGDQITRMCVNNAWAQNLEQKDERVVASLVHRLVIDHLKLLWSSPLEVVRTDVWF